MPRKTKIQIWQFNNKDSFIIQINKNYEIYLDSENQHITTRQLTKIALKQLELKLIAEN